MTRTIARAAASLLGAAAILISPAAHSRSINDAVGKTSFTWVRAISDAGISAAGECLGARDGSEAVLTHPAAAAGMEHGLAKLSYVSHYADTQYGSIGYAGRFGGRDLALRVTYVNFGEFIRTDRTGQRLGTFSAGDIGLSLTLARKVRDDLKIGGTVTYLHSKLDDFTAQAAAVDLGMLYYPPFDNMTVGAVLSNLGTVFDSYTSGYNESLPICLTVGVRKGLAHAPLTLMADVLFPNDNDITYALGVEANINDTLFLYAGTKSRSDIDIKTMRAETDYAGITTFGFGLIVNRYRFNYAYIPDDMIEDVHKVTFSIETP